MVDPASQSARTWQRDASRSALAMVVVALIVLSPNAASAQAVQPLVPQLHIEFRLTLTPDKDAEDAGAVAISNQVGMPRGIWIDRFTGAGCLPGSFEPSKVDLRSLSSGNAHSFEVSLRRRAKDDVVSLIEWKGKLEDGKISGDVWITLAGTPLTREEIEAKRRDDRNLAKRNMSIVRSDGAEMNQEAVEDAGRQADRRNELLAMQGRRLHFTFSTAEVIVIPLGQWSEPKGPAIRPDAVPNTEKNAPQRQGKPAAAPDGNPVP